MRTVAEFGRTAKSLSQNPLGIIALFIVLVYLFAALLVGFSDKLTPADRTPIVWFLVGFPPVVLFVFAWLVSGHHEKLYAPKDFQSDDGFLSARQAARPQLEKQYPQIESGVRSVLTGPELLGTLQSGAQPKQTLEAAADRIAQDIRSSSFITIDARKFKGDEQARVDYPVSAFASVGELLNQVYHLLAPRVQHFEYGHSWVLKDSGSGAIIRSARMLRDMRPAQPFHDTRALADVGIAPGMTLVVVNPSAA